MRQLERGFRKYIDKNWGYILIGLWLTSEAIDAMYEIRGYKAVGSEFLVLTIFLIAVEMLRKAIRFARCYREGR